MIIRALLLATMLALALATAPVSAETRYIKDELAVPLRSGPSNAHRILHAGLLSGTALVVLGEDQAAGFTQVRTADGTEGWLPSQYLVAEPIARHRLETATRRIDTLQTQLAELRRERDALRTESNESGTATEQLTAEVARLESELAEIRRVSAGALEQHAQMLQLEELNQRLRAEVRSLVEDVRDLESNRQQRWLLTGAGLLFGGLFLGLWLRSSSRSDGWA